MTTARSVARSSAAILANRSFREKGLRLDGTEFLRREEGKKEFDMYI